MPPSPKRDFDARVERIHAPYPHYDVRQGARTYASIGGTLAGFSFAAVVLLARSGIDCTSVPLPDLCQPMANKMRDQATAAFLIAFFGCVTGAFVYAITGAEEILTQRTHSMGLLGSSGFALGIGYAFWGLALLAHLFLAGTTHFAVFAANAMVMGIAAAAPAFIAFPAIDILLAYGPATATAAPDAPTSRADGEGVHLDAVPRPSRDAYWWTFGPAYVIVLVAFICRLRFGSQLAALSDRGFTALFMIAFGFALVSLVSTLYVSGKEHEYAVGPKRAGLIAAVHALLLWALVMLLPPST